MPATPNNDSNFLKRHNELLDLLTKKVDKGLTHSADLEKLIKEMIMYFKALEKAYEKGNISSKLGKEDNLYNDKGFFKLLTLITEISDTTRKSIDKYSSGKRLLDVDKQSLARFSQEMSDAIKESNERIGLPINELLGLMTENLENDKINDKLKLDLLEQLKTYSQEDIAISENLKSLIEETTKDGKISSGQLADIVNELQKTREDYTNTQAYTFAPLSRIKRTLDDMNVSFDGFKGALTSSQRSNEKPYKGGFENRGGILDMIGGLADWGVRGAAIKMSGIPALRKFAPMVAGSGSVVGGLLTTYLGTKALGDLKNLGGSLSGLAGKTAKVATKTGKVLPEMGRGVGGVLGKLALPALLGDLIYNYQKGFNANKNKDLLDRTKNARTQLVSGLTLGLIPKNNISAMGNRMDTAISEPISNAISDLQVFIGDQNKKIFGSQLNLGQMLSNVISNIGKGASDLTAGVVSTTKNVVKGLPKPLSQVVKTAYTAGKAAYTAGKDLLGFHKGMPAAGRVTSAFGMRAHPLGGKVKPHTGIDIGGKEGSPIKAIMGGGKVIYAGSMSGYGNMVAVRTPEGRVLKYGHLHDIDVRKGQNLSPNQVLGTMGHTGEATGTHLHFETTKIGVSNKQALMKSGTGYKQGLYENPLKSIDEYAKKTGVKSRADGVSPMPKKKAKVPEKDKPEKPPHVVVHPNVTGNKSNRKLKSDSDLINFHNTYGVMN